MSEINTHEVLHIYNEVLYTDVDVKNNYNILKGSYLKNIAVVILEVENNVSNLQFVEKILQACKITEHDYQIMSIEKSNEIFSLINSIHPEVLITFGISVQNDSFTMFKPNNKPFRFNNIKMLLTEPIHQLIENQALKSALWSNGLKPLFNI